MASLKNIKLKIQSVKKTRQVTKAMEAVSAVKMRKTQEQAIGARPYAMAALSILEKLSGTHDLSNHTLAKTQAGKTCLIVITSDKGLAGALNSNVLKQVSRTIGERNLTPENTVALCMGRRGADFLAARGFELLERMENVSDNVSETEMRRVIALVLGQRARGEVNECHVIYTNFKSTFEQEAVVRQLLPLSPEVLEQIVAGITPVKGKYAWMEEMQRESVAAYTIEPSAEEVLNDMLPRLLAIALYHSLAEAKASEHSARMVAMKNATDKAGEVAHSLTLKFNKARQAAITGEVSEITSGIEAMR